MIVSIIVIKPITQYMSLRIAFEGWFFSSRSKSIDSRFLVKYELTLKDLGKVHTCIYVSLYRSKE